MRSTSRLATVLLASALAVGAAGPVFAAADHSHDAGAMTLTLDHGRKWPTDESLRTGMSGIRTAMAAALEPIHKNTLPAARYGELAAAIETQVERIVKNCKLPDAADAQLHIVLAQIHEGVEGMKGAERQAGAVKVVTALDAYGKHFDDTGWKPLAH
ncbi:hypothetical protein TSO221_31940 [Azospirillum sp. TSO22-1]|nr:hypothetical protein TSO221_31940 [Azospirillum sp. TSO22-1]